MVFQDPEHWVRVAEKIAKENGGFLPGYYWLRNNGYHGLAHARYKHPELFSHIAQVKRYRSLAQWVIVAELLAKGNNGILPSQAALQKIGHYGLAFCLRKNPGSFSHITQDKPQAAFMSAAEWVLVAERIAFNNSGILPCKKALKQQGHWGMVTAIRLHPEMFSHIEQDGLRKKPEEWVPVAKRLASENSGVIPNSAWLRSNGYAGLACAIPRRPDLFGDFKQERRDRHGRIIENPRPIPAP